MRQRIFRLQIVITWLACGFGATTHAQPPGDAARDTREAATKVIERYLHVQGYSRPLTEVYPRRVKQRVLVGKAREETRWEWIDDGRGNYRLEVMLPSGIGYIEQSDPPNRAWQYSDKIGTRKLSDPGALAAALLKRPTLDTLRATYARWARLKDIERDGRKLNVLLLERASGGNETWYFDDASGVLVRAGPPYGIPRSDEFATVFRDFRQTDLGLEPFEVVVGSGAAQTIETILHAENRITVAPDVFQMPAAVRANWDKATEVMNNYVRACGASLDLARVVARVTKMRTEDETNGSVEETTMWQKLPDWVAFESTVEGVGKNWRGYNGGDTGWIASELAGERKISGTDLRLFLKGTDLRLTEHFTRLMPWRMYRGIKDVAGRRAHAIDLGTEEGQAGTHYFDVETKQLIRLEATLGMGDQGALPVTMDFSDYRAIDGVQVAFRTTLVNPAIRRVTTVLSVEHNVEIPDETFTPRKIE